VWLVGARGSVATTATVGLLALQAGLVVHTPHRDKKVGTLRSPT
jgi:hypothetical protein